METNKGLSLTGHRKTELWMLLTDPFADIRVGITREILWLSVALEASLAVANFRFRDRSLLACINTVVFAAFAIFATARWLAGYQSCGCSGNLELPGWIFILIDFAIVAWFTTTAIGRQSIVAGAHQIQTWWQSWSPERRGQIIGLGLFGGLLVVLQLPIAAPLRAAALGEPQIQAFVSLDGELTMNQQSTGQAEIWNRSSATAKIVGLSRSCRCFQLQTDPVATTIGPGQRVTFPLIIQPEQTGPLHQRVVLFLDHPEQFTANVDVVSSVKGDE